MNFENRKITNPPVIVELLARGGGGKTTITNRLISEYGRDYISRRQAVLGFRNLIYKIIPKKIIAAIFHLKIKLISKTLCSSPGNRLIYLTSIKYSTPKDLYNRIDHLSQHLISFDYIKLKSLKRIVILDEGIGKHGMLLHARGASYSEIEELYINAPKPDILIYINVSDENAKKRREKFGSDIKSTGKSADMEVAFGLCMRIYEDSGVKVYEVDGNRDAVSISRDVNRLIRNF